MLTVECLEGRQLLSGGAMDGFMSAGNPEPVGLLLPAVQKVREAAAPMSLVEYAANQNVAPHVNNFATPEENELIGLLLPAVQKVRESAARFETQTMETATPLLAGTYGRGLVFFDGSVRGIDAVFSDVSSSPNGIIAILIGL